MNIRQTPKDKDVDLILHTPGGLVLAADEIIMEKDSVLGPVDPQINRRIHNPQYTHNI